ncbi:FeoB-associated Cys-rich membrane protein [Robiginitalea sp. M366]|nr:FeoB-associated Cys-rich membrane protein [Robiginitalea aestuariiviva]MDG1571282.1 FeoB-associated Cys-rich membrane protein [Robiginitalea aestuariiviva]
MEFWQHLLAYLILAGAVFYLIRKFLWKPRKSKGCDAGDCNCH